MEFSGTKTNLHSENSHFTENTREKDTHRIISKWLSYSSRKHTHFELICVNCWPCKVDT